jgi:hypothetical protein
MIRSTGLLGAMRRSRSCSDEMTRFALPRGAPYRWNLDEAQIVFARGEADVVADLSLTGQTSTHEGTFLWGWANDAIPLAARRGVETVKAFGQEHGLSLLMEPEWPGGRPEGLEMLAIASRILDAEGCWIENSGDLTLFFALRNFRIAVRH